MYVQGVSTRKVKTITEEWSGHSFWASAISPVNKRMDASLEALLPARIDLGPSDPERLATAPSEALADGSSGRRIAAGRRPAKRARRRRRTGDRPALRFRSPAPRTAAERLAFPGLSLRSGSLHRAGATARERRRRGRRPGWERGSGRRESRRHGESLAALCHLICRRIRPACRDVAMSDKIPLSDNMQNASLTDPGPPQALSFVALSSSIYDSGDSMNEDKLTIDISY
jgi:Transposase, Mutator family